MFALTKDRGRTILDFDMTRPNSRNTDSVWAVIYILELLVWIPEPSE